MTQCGHRRIRRLLACSALIAGCCLVAPGGAFAGVGLGIAPTFPTSATVGDAGLAASLTITNLNTQPDTQATVCNAGAALPCLPADEGITLMPSCGLQGPFSTCATADPGVYRVSSTATGAAGSACAGMTFSVAPIAGDAFGRVRFTPDGGTAVVLPTPGTFCRIDFTVDVLAVPAVDARTGVDGAQTIQVADATQFSDQGTTGSGRGSSSGSSVSPPPPKPPPPPPPAAPPPCVPPPGPAPPGQELCASPLAPSGAPIRGTARIAGQSGCVTRNFNVTVTGRQIRRVAFYIDGKLVRTLSKPNRGTRFVLPIRPNRLSRGTHRVVARTTFAPSSGTRARSLRVVFQRCARAASAPKFTG
jgi:hypothetical protein